MDIVDTLEADVLIVQECEDPSRSTTAYQKWASNHIWEGDNKNKGLGILAKPEIALRRLDWYNTISLIPHSKSPKSSWCTADLKYFVPFSINNEWTCVAVWTKGHRSQAFRYIGQLWKFVQLHKSDLLHEKTLIAGDFNSNTIWDRIDGWWSHSDVVVELRDLGMESLYHLSTGEKQGAETTPTFFMHRNLEKPYHIDYIFAREPILSNFQLEVGPQDVWLPYSDHIPLILTI